MFKSLLAFELTKQINFDINRLKLAFKNFEFTPCGSHDAVRLGFVPVIDGSEDVIEHIKDYYFFAVQWERKLLPSDVIKTEVNNRLNLRPENERTKQLSKELKEQVVMEFLPRAFSKYEIVHGYIDIKNDRIYLGANSNSKCDSILALIRKALGSLPIIPITFDLPVDVVMTEWVKTNLPKDLFSNGDIELVATSEASNKAIFKNQDVGTDEITTAINHKIVKKLSVNYDNLVDFTLASTKSNMVLLNNLELTLYTKDDEVTEEYRADHQRNTLMLFGNAIDRVLEFLFDKLGKKKVATSQ